MYVTFPSVCHINSNIFQKVQSSMDMVTVKPILWTSAVCWVIGPCTQWVNFGVT